MSGSTTKELGVRVVVAPTTPAEAAAVVALIVLVVDRLRICKSQILLNKASHSRGFPLFSELSDAKVFEIKMAGQILKEVEEEGIRREKYVVI